jgi:hypothetical protein
MDVKNDEEMNEVFNEERRLLFQYRDARSWLEKGGRKAGQKISKGGLKKSFPQILKGCHFYIKMMFQL